MLMESSSLLSDLTAQARWAGHPFLFALAQIERMRQDSFSYAGFGDFPIRRVRVDKEWFCLNDS